MAWFTLPKGWFGPYDNNEVEVVATDDDPAAFRGGKTWKPGQGWNLFKVSGNVVRSDGRHEEYALLRFRLAPNESDGAIECIVRRGNDEVPAFYVDPNGFHCLTNFFAPNISGAGGTFLKNGPWELHLQGDRNLVLYDTRTQPWKVVWSAGTQL